MTSKFRYAVLNADCAQIGVCNRFAVAGGGVLLTGNRRYGAFDSAWAPGTWTYIVEASND